MSDYVEGELTSKCACDACDVFVPVREGDICEPCSRRCVDVSNQWHVSEYRHRVHSMPDDAPTVGRPTEAEQALDDVAGTATQRAAALFARSLREARRDAVTKYGRVPVTIAEAFASGAIAVGATQAVQALRARRTRR